MDQFLKALPQVHLDYNAGEIAHNILAVQDQSAQPVEAVTSAQGVLSCL